MKKLLVCLFLLVISCSLSFAQEFKKFKTDFGIFYAQTAKDRGNGGGIYLEPKYNITDQISAGIRFEAMAGVSISDLGGADDSGSLVTSTLLTGDYYINTNDFRPWVGLGIGRYTLRSYTDGQDVSDILNNTLRTFGIAPRIGFTAGHFRVGLEYNLCGRGFNYGAFKIGFEIGGGRK